MKVVIGDIKIDDDTDYWIYVLQETQWTTIYKNIVSGTKYFSSFFTSPIKERDVIIVYVKGGKKINGFVAVAKTIGKLENNKDIRIFNDSNLNKKVVKIGTITNFNTGINLALISNGMVCDEFKSVASFRSRFLSGNIQFTKLPKTIGLELLTTLHNIYDEEAPTKIVKSKQTLKKSISQSIKKITKHKNDDSDSDGSDSDDSDSDSSDSDSSDSDSSDSDSSDSDSSDSDSSDSDSSDSDSSDSDSSDSDSSDSDSSDSDSSDSDSSDSDSSDDSDDDGQRIPIMIMPCKNFKWPNVKNIYDDKENEKMVIYFKSHYSICERCEVINNNNTEPTTYFKDGKFEYEEGGEYDVELFDEIEKYSGVEKYSPFGKIKKPTFKIKYINDETNIYNKCILLIWSIPKSK
jgi:hypothetical protein